MKKHFFALLLLIAPVINCSFKHYEAISHLNKRRLETLLRLEPITQSEKADLLKFVKLSVKDHQLKARSVITSPRDLARCAIGSVLTVISTTSSLGFFGNYISSKKPKYFGRALLGAAIAVVSSQLALSGKNREIASTRFARIYEIKQLIKSAVTKEELEVQAIKEAELLAQQPQPEITA